MFACYGLEAWINKPVVVVDKKAMIKNRYNWIQHPALDTKRERVTYN